MLGDQPLREAVDEAVDRAAELVALPLHGVELVPAGTAGERVQASLAFLRDARRVAQEPADLVPHRRLQRFDRQQAGVAAELPWNLLRSVPLHR